MFQLTAKTGKSVTLGGTFDVWDAFAAEARALAKCPTLSLMASLDGIELTPDDLATLVAEIDSLANVTLSPALRTMLAQIRVLAGGGSDDDPTTDDVREVARTMAERLVALSPNGKAGVVDAAGHSHAPPGSPEGGRFTSSGTGGSAELFAPDPTTGMPAGGASAVSTPKMARDARAFVTKVLAETTITPQMVDQLDRIVLVKDEVLADDALGLYKTSGPARVIRLAAYDNYANHTLVHELGHHVHLTKLNDATAAEWQTLSHQGGNARISHYARTNTTEHFAEAFMAYHNQGKLKPGAPNREALRHMEPNTFAFMARLDDTKLLPPGERTMGQVAVDRGTKGGVVDAAGHVHAPPGSAAGGQFVSTEAPGAGQADAPFTPDPAELAQLAGIFGVEDATRILRDRALEAAKPKPKKPRKVSSVAGRNVYHTTSVDGANMIMEQGLKTGDPWKGRPPAVYFTGNADDAARYAKALNAVRKGDEYGVVEFKRPARPKRDPESETGIWLGAGATKVDSYYVHRDIPPGDIVAVRIYKRGSDQLVRTFTRKALGETVFAAVLFEPDDESEPAKRLLIAALATLNDDIEGKGGVVDAAGHTHAPSGSPEGGRFTSEREGSASDAAASEAAATPAPRVPSAPLMNKATRALVDPVIAQAGLTPLMLDKLRIIDAYPGTTMTYRIRTPMPGDDGMSKPVTGVYWTSSRSMAVAGNGARVERTIIHELGHHIHLSKMTNATAAEWAKISNNGQNARITNYARTNATEHFAEAFAAYHNTKPLTNTLYVSERAQLRAYEIAAHDFIARLDDTKLLKPGKTATINEANQRRGTPKGSAKAGTVDAAGHVHAPSGSSEGGQFVSQGEGGGEAAGSAPEVSAGPPAPAPSTPRMNKRTAALVEPILAQTEILPIMVDRLNAIVATPGGVINYKLVDGTPAQALGLYHFRQRKVEFAIVQGAMRNTLIHEIGHHVHMTKMTIKTANAWEKLSQNGDNARITAYARTNRTEHFAEAFAAYHNRNIGENTEFKPTRKTLLSLEPKVHDFIAALDESKLMPAGRRTSSVTAGNRIGPKKVKTSGGTDVK